MATYWIADTHLGHPRILQYCHRPFLNEEEKKKLADGIDFRVSKESVELNDTTIINNINSVVGRNDTLWHLGDFSMTDPETAKKLRDRIDCQNINIVWGNHDKPHKMRHLFNKNMYQGLVNVDGQMIWMSHYPNLSWNKSGHGSWGLYGHVHGTSRRNSVFKAIYDILLSLDVGVDGPDCDGEGYMSDHRFIPWSMEEIRKYMLPKIENFKKNKVF